MKNAIGFILAVLMVMPVIAFAGGPIDGTYLSTDLGGSMLTGRYSESWSAPGGRLMIGNTINMLSWDGATLGTQWWIYCADISIPPILIGDTVDGQGNGFEEWLVHFQGGLMILDGNGPWGDGSEPSYTATLDSYSEIKTYQYVDFEIVQVVTTISLQGRFIGFNDDCMTMSISNTEELGTTDTASLPPSYPSFLAPSTCAPTRTMGSWGEADEFTLIVTGCTVPTRVTTWGEVKALYSE